MIACPMIACRVLSESNVVLNLYLYLLAGILNSSSSYIESLHSPVEASLDSRRLDANSS